TRFKAQLHVLVEQERSRVERTQRAELVGAPDDAGGNRPPHRARPATAPRLVARGKDATGEECRYQRLDRSRDGMSAVLDAAVGVQEPWGQERAAAGGVAGEPREAVVEQLDI